MRDAVAVIQLLVWLEKSVPKGTEDELSAAHFVDQKRRWARLSSSCISSRQTDKGASPDVSKRCFHCTGNPHGADGFNMGLEANWIRLLYYVKLFLKWFGVQHLECTRLLKCTARCPFAVSCGLFCLVHRSTSGDRALSLFLRVDRTQRWLITGIHSFRYLLIENALEACACLHLNYLLNVIFLSNQTSAFLLKLAKVNIKRTDVL